VETDGYIYVYPAQPQFIYVPTYDPAVVYFRRSGFFPGPAIWFSVGFVIGAWLNHDCDWQHHRVFYHGWEHGPAWLVRSRPYIHVNNIYVNSRYQNVIVNRAVVDHRVNYGALNRYQAIHRDTDYSAVRHQRGEVGQSRVPAAAGQPRPDNKIIRRNIDPNDARIDANRGRGQLPQAPPQAPPQGRTETRAPHTPIQGPVVAPAPQQEERARRPDINRTQPVSPAPRPQVTQPPQPRPQVNPNVQAPRSQGSVFGGNQGRNDTQDASRRGQASRGNVYQPAPAARTAAQPRAQNSPPVQAGQPGRPQGRRPR
jgi:hypothetical protein